jgi:MFS family permease
MLYTIGSIVGGASTGMVWSRLGARRAYTLGAGVFAVGTLCCALAPLIAARGVQGWAGGLVPKGYIYAAIGFSLGVEALKPNFARF